MAKRRSDPDRTLLPHHGTVWERRRVVGVLFPGYKVEATVARSFVFGLVPYLPSSQCLAKVDDLQESSAVRTPRMSIGAKHCWAGQLTSAGV